LDETAVKDEAAVKKVGVIAEDIETELTGK
jgi:hypothetical protein